MIDLPERSYLIIDNKLGFDKNQINNYVEEIQICNLKIFIGKKLEYFHYVNGENHYIFLGDFYDPYNTKYNNYEVTYNIFSKSDSFEVILNNLYSIFGKWIVIEISNNRFRCMGDANATKSIKYYTNGLVVSDIASIVAKICKCKSVADMTNDSDYKIFYENKYKLTNWWCGDATFFENVLSLLPNNILNYKNENICTVGHKIISMDKSEFDYNSKEFIEYCYSKSKELLIGFYESLSNRCKFGLTVTAGKDSRIAFAACNEVCDENSVQYFIIDHHNSDNCDEISISKELCKKLNCKLNVYEAYQDTKIINLINEYFPEVNKVYSEYNYQANINDSETIVYGLIPEIITGYYDNRIVRLNAKSLCDIARCAGSKYAEIKYNEWINDVKKCELPYGYTYLDLFYWEHRGGRWGAQTVNVCDLFQNSLWGFNCREFYDIWMKTPKKIRKWPKRRNLDTLASRFGEIYGKVEYLQPKGISRLIEEIETNPVLCLIFRQLNYKCIAIKNKKKTNYN